MLIDDLERARCRLFEEEILMNVFGGLDESHDNVFFNSNWKMLIEPVTIDDAKALLLSHECRMEIKNVISLSHLPFVSLTIKHASNQGENLSPVNILNIATHDPF